MAFRLHQTCPRTAARRGTLTTAHGDIQTPMFMPVGTQATVKAVAPNELHELGAAIILGNTYHLNLRPGPELVRAAGGLHRFMGWDGAILTDSGGYQVFSLASLRKMDAHGVTFRNHVNGAEMHLSPVTAMAIQRDLGSDIAMVFDECTPYPCSQADAARSLATTLAWARACREQPRAPGQLVFGIVQGSMYLDLRAESAAALRAMEFDGYAIGGLSVGEPDALLFPVLAGTAPLLPADQPRYLMGVGTPAQIVRAVGLGVDLFDCVLPTRVGRNGSAYTADGLFQVKAGRYKDDFRPITEGCGCYACRHFTRAYIRHLLNVGEILGIRLLTLHNLHFYLQLMRDIRANLEAGTFGAFHDAFLARYQVTQKSTDADDAVAEAPTAPRE